jgi:protein gp37
VLVIDKVLEPLHWKKPRRIFVNSMSDLFHERLSNAEIAVVFCVMGAARQHTFQTLTKRDARMRQWFAWLEGRMQKIRERTPGASEEACYAEALIEAASTVPGLPDMRGVLRSLPRWPLPNVWLGVSVESQEYAEERLTELLGCPAAIRFVSYEPALGPVKFKPWLRGVCPQCSAPWELQDKKETLCGPCGGFVPQGPRRLDWIIVGGESGPGSRPFDVEWARSVVSECKEEGVACFVKQLGRKPMGHSAGAMHEEVPLLLVSRKGNDMDEWPTDLRVRQFPAVAA